ncbi:MAG TPA: hypothetical protein VNZ86_06075, partial [Bacteroidia bacterium]|nr:hypothetical protein [Bacteroidia bacterium]
MLHAPNRPVTAACMLLISFLLFFTTSKAQQGFQKTFGGPNGDQAFGIVSTPDHGFITAGYTASFGAGHNDIYLTKSDSAGTVSWARTLGGSLDDFAFDIQPTTDGGYILTGYSKSWGAGKLDAFLIKTDAAGDTLWTKTYGGPGDDFGNRVQQTSDGGFIVAGYTLSYRTVSDSGSAFLLRTDATGNLLWSRAFGGSAGITDAYDIKQTPDKGFVITGYTNDFGEKNGDAYLCKTDSMGQIQFLKTYGGSSVDWGSRILLLPGGYLIGASIGTDSTRDIDPWLIWTNLNGDTLSTRTYGGLNYDYLQAVLQTSDGGYVLSGYESSFGFGQADGFLIKTNAAGDTLFTRLYGSAVDDELNTLSICSDKGYLLAGISSGTSTTNNSNWFTVRTDVSGKNT